MTTRCPFLGQGGRGEVPVFNSMFCASQASVTRLPCRALPGCRLVWFRSVGQAFDLACCVAAPAGPHRARQRKREPLEADPNGPKINKGEEEFDPESLVVSKARQAWLDIATADVNSRALNDHWVALSHIEALLLVT